MRISTQPCVHADTAKRSRQQVGNDQYPLEPGDLGTRFRRAEPFGGVHVKVAGDLKRQDPVVEMLAAVPQRFSPGRR
jgi:hypothetical protein